MDGVRSLRELEESLKKKLEENNTIILNLQGLVQKHEDKNLELKSLEESLNRLAEQLDELYSKKISHQEKARRNK